MVRVRIWRRKALLWTRLAAEAREWQKEKLMTTPQIVSRTEWDEVREQLLEKEKEVTRARDALAAERRRMPWMAVEKDYRFEGPNGPVACSSSSRAAVS